MFWDDLLASLARGQSKNQQTILQLKDWDVYTASNVVTLSLHLHRAVYQLSRTGEIPGHSSGHNDSHQSSCLIALRQKES